MKIVALLVALTCVSAHASYQPVVLAGAVATPSNGTTTVYMPVHGYFGVDAVQADNQQKVPGLLPSRLYCATSAPGAGTSWSVTLEIGGVATDWSCTISDAATSCEDTSGTAVNSGLATYELVPTNNPGQGPWHCVLTGALR